MSPSPLLLPTCTQLSQQEKSGKAGSPGRNCEVSNKLQQQQQDLIAASYVTRLQLEECPCMYSKLHSDSWLTTLCCWPHMQHGSHSKSSFPDGLRAGFASRSLTHLLCVLSCCLQNCGFTHSPAAAGSIKGGFRIISDTIWTASFRVL